MAETSIEWADYTFNPWTGCQKVSAGCDHCYAEGWAKRSGHVQWGPHGARRRTSEANWRQPLKWAAQAAADGVRRKVFCASLADVFDNHHSIDEEWREDLWDLISCTPQLDWLLLTKRPQNIANMLPIPFDFERQFPHVWLGTTVENQTEADRRIPHLLAVPARVRFLSCEPLLGPVDLTLDGLVCKPCPWCLDGSPDPETGSVDCPRCDGTHKGNEWGIDWVICGGESGPGARPMHPDWARSLRDQCQAAGVPFLFKQWGEWMPYSQLADDGDWLYHPEREPRNEASRRCKFESCCLDGDGDRHAIGRPNRFHRIPAGAFKGINPMSMYRIGKKRAGRLLDGREWNEFPQVQA